MCGRPCHCRNPSWLITYIPTAINIWANLYIKWAMRDGRIDSCEAICVRFNRFSALAMIIVQIVMIIWGAVVVFGAWATWTDDFEKYSENKDDFNFCNYTPMIFAFRLLILQWVSSNQWSNRIFGM